MFRPEFLNRIDGVVVFHALNKQNIRAIVDLLLKTVTTQLTEKGVKLEVSEAAKDLLGERGYDEAFGARPLRRTIQDMVVDKLSEAILRSEFRSGDTAMIDAVDGQIVLRPAQVAAMANADK